jgi:protein-S-isoprenylcysteine O-methyltransferase Ste14/uncharacterized membrane protein (UPF0127 family)
VPLLFVRKQRILPVRVLTASKYLARLAGWLGRPAPVEDELLQIVPCRAVHTWGMRFPIDILFLNSDSRVLESISSLPPNRLTSPQVKAVSVIEAPAGFIRREGIQLGDKLMVRSDGEHNPGTTAWSYILHWPLNLFMAILWAQLIYYIFGLGWERVSILSAGVLIHNSVLFILFLLRRPSRNTSWRASDWLIALATLACAMALRPVEQAWQGGIPWPLILQLAGIAGILVSLFSLGRSFGIIPANRQVQVHGAYRLVRHPLYASELLFYAGFLLGNPSAPNIILAGFILIGQIYRSLAEETLLMKDPAYKAYAQVVRSRFIPYIV